VASHAGFALYRTVAEKLPRRCKVKLINLRIWLLDVLMNNQRVSRREYKVILEAEKFTGKEQELLQAADKFWSNLKKAISVFVVGADGRLNNIQKGQTIRFYDTDTCRLHRNDYIFRERSDIGGQKREVTLKFRHPDRYIAQDRNMDTKDSNKGETKFEEDIKRPFLTLYSFSTTLEIASSKNLNKMKDLVGLFPDLENKLEHYNKDEQIDRVGNFTAIELVITGGNLQISKSPKVESECVLVVWYDNDGDHEEPVVVEFSFRYGDKDGTYGGEIAKRHCNVFMELNRLKWINRTSLTKTAYIYSLSNCKGLEKRDNNGLS
jgi:hypothetical protein